MRKYELLLTIPGTFDDMQAEKKLTEVTELVKQYGERVNVSTLGKNRLAYPIKQIRYGYFYTIVFEAEPAQTKALEEKLRLTTEILRAVVSVFKTELSQAQRSAYAADDLALTTIAERKEGVPRKHSSSPIPSMSIDGANSPSIPKEESKVDMEGIKKKLDQILDESDIIPGV